jgi:hypothetical protein
MRFKGFSISDFTNSLLSFHIISAFFGKGGFFYLVTSQHFFIDGFTVHNHILSLCLLSLSLVLLYKITWRLGNEAKIYICGGFLLLSFFSIASSLHGIGGPRYAYTPCILLQMALLLNINISGAAIKKQLVLLLATSLYLHTFFFFTYACCYSAAWPKWRTEVQDYREGKDNRLYVYPYHADSNWFIEMK